MASGRIIKAVRPYAPVVRAQVLTAAEQAGAILAQAEAECAAMREQAWREGWASGLSEWQAALDDAATQAQQYRASIEPELGRLAVRIAAKILGDTITADPSLVLAAVRQALRGVTRERHIVIRVAPGLSATVEPHLDRLAERLPAGCQLSVKESPDVDPGGCVIASEVGVIDARIATQLAQIERALTRGRE